MYSRSTLLLEVISNEIKILQSIGMPDPATQCSGVIWTLNLVNLNPKSTLGDWIDLIVSSYPADAGAWVSGFLGNQWQSIPPDMRVTLTQLIHGDECLLVVKRSRRYMSPEEYALLKDRYLLVHPATSAIIDEAGYSDLNNTN